MRAAIIIIIIIIYSSRVFHISISWWFFTVVWVIASLLKSPGIVSVLFLLLLYSLRTSFSWWSFNRVWVTASLLKSAELFWLFRWILTMLSFRWSRFFLCFPNPPVFRPSLFETVSGVPDKYHRKKVWYLLSSQLWVKLYQYCSSKRMDLGLDNLRRSICY